MPKPDHVNEDATKDEWDACPQGELSQMVQTRNAQRRRRVIDRVAMAAACLMTAVAVTGYIWGLYIPVGVQDSHVGGIACAEVVSQLPDYLQGNVNDSLRQRIATHLSGCPHCEAEYDRLNRASAISSVWRRMPLIALSP